MKTAGGEAALGGGSIGAPREKAAPQSSSHETAPHRDTKGVLATGHFFLNGFSWQRTAVETGGRWKSRGCVFSPPIHSDAASVGLTSEEEGTAVNRQQPRKGSPAFKEWPQAWDEAFLCRLPPGLSSQLWRCLLAPFYLFLLLPSQTLAWFPALQTVSQPSACLAPSSFSLAALGQAGSLPITPYWFHSLEAGLAPDAPPSPTATSGILVTFVLRCIKACLMGISHCAFCMFVSLADSITACLFPFNVHSCLRSMSVICPLREPLEVAPMWSGDHWHQRPREGRGL